jgi:hypothetical protein
MTLLPWPIEHGGYPTTQDTLDYERARAAAAMARLRVAVEALRDISQRCPKDLKLITSEDIARAEARDALTAIGDLPNE